MNIPRILARVACALGVALMPARAQHPDRPKAEAPHHVREAARAEGVARRLKLSEAQRKAIQAIRARHGDSLKADRQAAREARRDLREASRDPRTSLEHLRAFHEAAAQRQFELLLARRAMRAEVQAVLTPEQREEAARLRGVAEGRMKARREGRWGRKAQ